MFRLSSLRYMYRSISIYRSTIYCHQNTDWGLPDPIRPPPPLSLASVQSVNMLRLASLINASSPSQFLQLRVFQIPSNIK